MVDPEDITKFDRTLAELEEFWLFSLVVAGKVARTQARLLDKFLTSLPKGGTPFKRIAAAVKAGTFEDRLRESHLGQYGRLSRAFRESLRLDMWTCSVKDLEGIHGCGPKTARLFLMHSRPDQRLAAIDTHILKLFGEHRDRFLAFMRDRGLRLKEVPKATPGSGPTYDGCEAFFLMLADEAGMSPADFDLSTWKRFSARKAAV